MGWLELEHWHGGLCGCHGVSLLLLGEEKIVGVSPNPPHTKDCSGHVVKENGCSPAIANVMLAPYFLLGAECFAGGFEFQGKTAKCSAPKVVDHGSVLAEVFKIPNASADTHRTVDQHVEGNLDELAGSPVGAGDF